MSALFLQVSSIRNAKDYNCSHWHKFSWKAFSFFLINLILLKTRTSALCYHHSLCRKSYHRENPRYRIPTFYFLSETWHFDYSASSSYLLPAVPKQENEPQQYLKLPLTSCWSCSVIAYIFIHLKNTNVKQVIGMDTRKRFATPRKLTLKPVPIHSPVKSHTANFRTHKSCFRNFLFLVDLVLQEI